jgi:hypothetical protein
LAAGVGCAALLAASSARADDPASPTPQQESVRATVDAVKHDEASRMRADLPARLANPDTADGRVDGDVGIVVGLGITLDQQPRAASELRVRYLDMVGVFVTYEDGFGAAGVDPARVLATGMEVRPLFLGRLVTGNELGIRWADLVIDSFGLELGGFFQQPALGSFASRPGLQAGLGVELPLFGKVKGPWLDVHGGVRWSDDAIEGRGHVGPSDGALFVSFTLAYHHIFSTHLVDLHDEAP